MKKYLLYIIFPLLFCFNACDLEDESEFSAQSNSVPLNDLIPAAISQLAYNQSALHGRSCALIMHYLQSSESRVFFGNFNLPRTWYDATWIDGFYGGSLASANEMKRLATEEGNNNVIAISLILMANEFSSLTNTFGDIPFSEALQGADNITPKYDSQEDIYQEIFRMLDEAVQLIGSTGIASGLGQSDLVYRGDMQAWRRLANGLKARNLLNQRNQVPGMESEILSLIDASFSSSNEQANFNFDGDLNTNPLAKFGDERPSTLLLNPYFSNILIITDDPRFSSYAFSDFPAWQYYGDPQLTWSQFDSAIPILSYTELLFMKAEVQFHIGASMDEVSSSLLDAISSNMADNNVEIDSDVESFMSDAADLDGLNNEEALQKIIEQTYVSYYGYNFEQAWNNYRRTGYPDIVVEVDTPSPNNPSNILPRRLLYPKNEVDFNQANLEEAASRQGGALLDDDIWLFQ